MTGDKAFAYDACKFRTLTVSHSMNKKIALSSADKNYTADIFWKTLTLW